MLKWSMLVDPVSHHAITSLDHPQSLLSTKMYIHIFFPDHRDASDLAIEAMWGHQSYTFD